ncbi:DUF3331 domain-containing protein [Burkholderia sp. Ac-20365]|jgi:hypothetical protein|uniref:DUF3331 domain-containing protein n=1 Tax=Burkholderia sp. Ac-20365 TaxID=2703897 RepID=UPI00197C7C76|nr:DUF3331 domain-containing protein [Burkholderia sp. Ac-20365]MBN3761572.1 DUF3331 domain-containing protein [Burkholderia sp. Ac-20365]
MLLDANLVDPWTRTINLLSLRPDPSCTIEEPIDQPLRRRAVESNAATWEPCVTVIDRPSALTVVLDWRDPTKCCYREQLWVSARARVSGRCAMTGAAIEPGDDIFRPRPARPAPRNVTAMVLASAVEACAASLPPLLEQRCAPCSAEDVRRYAEDLALDAAG